MSNQQMNDIQSLIQDFQRSGMRELHLRADGVEIYMSDDASAAGLDAPAAPNLASPVVPAATKPSPSASAKPSRPAKNAANVAAASAPQASAAAIPEGSIVVKAPYLGSFYRAPKPGTPAYVEIGSKVEAETELCLVEVMKLFTAVRAEVAGTITAILASDGQMVEADQPLFVIKPA